MTQVVHYIDIPLHNLGLSLVVLAALIRGLFWPLNAKQFKSMIAMSKIAPKIKALQEKYKNDQQKLQQETMALYKAENVNPLAGCLPMLIQYPFLISVFYMVLQHKTDYDHTKFLWVGALPASVHVPMIFNVPLIGSSLAAPDAILLVLYALSMYVSVRFGSMPAADPSAAQTQKMMAFLSPAMLFFIGFKYAWPSAMVLYWLSSNVFQMSQQFYMLRKHHAPLSAIDSGHAVTQDVAPAPLPSGNGSSKRKKKGAKS